MRSTPQELSSLDSLKSKALTKVRVYWADPRPGTSGQYDFYSYDSSGRYEVADKRTYGMNNLKKLVDKMGGKVARAIIYDNQAPGHPEICRKENGSWSS